MNLRRKAGTTVIALDEIDREVVRILQDEGRVSVTELAGRIHLSQPAASARLRRLEDAGIIVGYGARIAPESVGLATRALIRLRTTHAQIADALTQFGRLTEITRILRVTGEDCFVVDVHARDARRLEEVIDAIGRFGPVSTSLVLREYPAHPITPAS
ncbi:Lrp/AsnC family transcriptional regulator [Microbacterium sp.]|uniref:Lrp/AsnC family transcriptional regulator n=1 Tax=Microbacterium sp. TaxID=51671 RepID=UPI003C77211E